MTRRRGSSAAGWLVAAALLTACSSSSAPGGAAGAPGTVSGATEPRPQRDTSTTRAPSATVTTAAGRPASTAGPTDPGSSVAPSTTAAAATTTIAPAGTSTAPAVPATTATTTTVAPDVALAAVQAYTGSTPGTADPANGAYAVGWVNQEGAAPSFSDATLGFAAALEYVNRLLSGAGGRVVELRTCAIQKEADGARCAQQLRDDPSVAVVVVGAVATGNTALLDGLRDVKPVILANPLTTADYLATDAVAYTAGSPGVISGLARYAAEGLPGGPPAKVAVLFPLGLAGEAAFQLLAKPVFERFGVTAVPVPVIESAPPAEWAPLFQTVGVADATAFLPILGARGCVGLDQALTDLASTATVLATDSCLGTAMSSHLTRTGRTGSAPEGWYFGGTGYRFGLPGSPEHDAFLQIASAYQQAAGLPRVDLTGYAATSFAAALTVIRLVNQAGAGAGDPVVLRELTRGFTGPMWGVVGPQSCGYDAFYPSLCGTQMGVQRYVAGAFVSVADGHNGASIDLAGLRAAP